MVDEKNNPQKVKENTAVENSEAGDKPQSDDIVKRAREEREGLERENERLEKNLKEMRDLEASRLLGSTAGGHIETMKTPAEKAEAQAQKAADEIVNAFK